MTGSSWLEVSERRSGEVSRYRGTGP